MSLLEDVFLQDEADEAQELEREVIDGYDEEPRAVSPNSDDNSEKEDEAEEDKRRVDPTKAKSQRVIKNPRFLLNPARLTGPRGIQVIPEHFKNFRFKGKGHEKEDLDLVLKKLEHWAYRLYPKFQFEDCLKKIETLGKKRPVMVHLHKIRNDQLQSDEIITQKDSSDEETVQQQHNDDDEFDKLLQQQIELARATPAPSSVKKTPVPSSVQKTVASTPIAVEKSLIMPKATSSPSINDEQKQRMIRNRQLAEERRLARLKQNNITKDSINNSITKQTTEKNVTIDDNNVINDITVDNIVTNQAFSSNVLKKHNRSNVIDSSDDENVVTKEITVELHSANNTAVDNSVANITVDENVIDSSDDENVVTKEITVELHSANNTTVDNNVKNITVDENVINEATKENVANKHNISNVIESSNEQNTIIEQISVELHKNDSVNSQITEQIEVSSNLQINEDNISKENQNAVNNDKVIKESEDLMDVDFSDDF